TSANNAANAVGLLGKDVRVLGGGFKGPEATLYYKLPANAQSATLEVRDKEGRVIKVFDQIETSAGLHEVKLTDLEPGDYKFNVIARDSVGMEMPVELSVAEHVNG